MAEQLKVYWDSRDINAAKEKCFHGNGFIYFLLPSYFKSITKKKSKKIKWKQYENQ